MHLILLERKVVRLYDVQRWMCIRLVSVDVHKACLRRLACGAYIRPQAMREARFRCKSGSPNIRIVPAPQF
jgi:hypothetical protein